MNLSLCSVIDKEWRLEYHSIGLVDTLSQNAGRDCSFILRIKAPPYTIYSADFADSATRLSSTIKHLRDLGHNVTLQFWTDWCDHDLLCIGNRGDEISKKRDYVTHGRFAVDRACSCTETASSCKLTDTRGSGLP